MRHAPSLRQRFIFIAIFSTFSFILLSISTKLYLTHSSEQRLADSRNRISAAASIQKLSKIISSSHHSLGLFLSSPNKKYITSFDDSLVEANQLLKFLNANSWVNKTNNIKKISLIKKEIKKINLEASKLFFIRKNVFKMFPGLGVANKYQFESNIRFFDLLNSSLEELESNIKNNTQLYIKVMETRDAWRRMIINNRLYALNLTVHLDANAIEMQGRDIETYINHLEKSFKELSVLITVNNNDLGFQTEYAISDFPIVLQQWKKGFYLMKQFAERGEWRVDVPILFNIINPSYLNLYSEIEALQRSVNYSSASDLSKQSEMFDSVSVVMWFLISLFIGSLMLIYYLMNRALIRPLSIMASNIKNKNYSKLSIKDDYIQSAEVDEFINAYSDMQAQINVRQSQLEHLALHDSLTKLPNRALIVDRINQCIKSSKRYDSKFILIMLDLDRFKEVNDTLGHAVGDEVLCQVSERLISCLRKTDTVARLGGDEFAILLTDIDAISLDDLVAKFVNALDDVFYINEHNLYIGSSFGVAVYPQHGGSPEILLKHADLAMYHSKKSNLDYSVYNHKNNIYNIKKLELLTELKHALDKNELYLKYQPIYSVRNPKIIGFECLLRWCHPIYGEVMPDEFIPNAEQTGLIKRITERVIQLALANVPKLRRYISDAYVSINVTAWDLQDENIISVVNDALSKNKMPPEAILFELTERSMMNDSSRVQSVLKILSDNGIRFAIDDFGTGFSSMSYLKQLPVSTLKIDKSFVSGMLNNIDDKLIVHSIIGLAHNLGLTVIAEGVEDKETATILDGLECDAIQGYLYSKPHCIETMLERLDNDNIRYLKIPT